MVQALGSGAYGEVFLCNDERTSTQVAVKWIRDFARDPICGKRILREIRLLASLKHENVLMLLDCFMPHADFDDVCIVMPYMHSDLHRVIYSKAKLSEGHSQAFTWQILRGLKYLHSAGVVHRDLKPPNILVNKDCTLKIADLGLARGRLNDEEVLTDYVVTRWYRAPELMLLPSHYCEAVDLWSVGCILAEILAREPLFPGRDHCDMLRRIAAVLGFFEDRDLGWLPGGEADAQVRNMVRTLRLETAPEKTLQEKFGNASQACLDLLHKLLCNDPTIRISAADALAHPYLGHLHDPAAETVAVAPFDWNFDRFEATKQNVKDRIYSECAKRHPEILKETTNVVPMAGPDEKLLGPPPQRKPRRTGQVVHTTI